MADTPTPNYGLTKPEATDDMSAFDTWLNPNWSKIEDAVSPPSGTTLPQNGTYNIGDRFYHSTNKSIYILSCKDANWGWHWRPVHDAISPWLTVPTTCMEVAGWTLNPVAANPFAIAFDNRGNCHWRGVIGSTPGTFARNTSFSVFKQLPQGLRPAYRGVYMLGHETLAVSTDNTNLNSWQGVRLYIPDNDANPTIRSFGGTADFNQVHLAGVRYAVGTSRYTTP
jgi:hypothetical protein